MYKYLNGCNNFVLEFSFDSSFHIVMKTPGPKDEATSPPLFRVVSSWGVTPSDVSKVQKNRETMRRKRVLKKIIKNKREREKERKKRDRGKEGRKAKH
jgi:hypothetical protein